MTDGATLLEVYYQKSCYALHRKDFQAHWNFARKLWFWVDRFHIMELCNKTCPLIPQNDQQVGRDDSFST